MAQEGTQIRPAVGAEVGGSGRLSLSLATHMCLSPPVYPRGGGHWCQTNAVRGVKRIVVHYSASDLER